MPVGTRIAHTRAMRGSNRYLLSPEHMFDTAVKFFSLIFFFLVLLIIFIFYHLFLFRSRRYSYASTRGRDPCACVTADARESRDLPSFEGTLYLRGSELGRIASREGERADTGCGRNFNDLTPTRESARFAPTSCDSRPRFRSRGTAQRCNCQHPRSARLCQLSSSKHYVSAF